MITYLYWITVIALSVILCLAIGRVVNWRVGVIVALVTLLIGWGAYYFKYEQLFVKNYGGIMSITIPAGLIHLSATWKEDHLWIENFDPKTNTCYFSEYSKGHLLEGQVIFKNCNPALPGMVTTSP